MVKTLAGILTWYIPGSHADVIIGRILEGWAYDGGPGPRLKLASMYVDQVPDRDMARAMAAKHNVPIVDTIEEALAPDSAAQPGPAHRAYPGYEWGTLAIWAWGAMRVVDYLESRDAVDPARLAIVGHSRGGKMALLAGARTRSSTGWASPIATASISGTADMT